MNSQRLRMIIDAMIGVLLLVCLLLTWRAFRAGKEDLETALQAATPVATATPTPEPADPNPERTLIITVMTLFENISKKRYDEAVEMFSEESQRKIWRESFLRQEKRGNPIVSFNIDSPYEKKYCKPDPSNEKKGQCELPIHLFRRDNDVSEWFQLSVDLIKVDGRWKISSYQQEKLSGEEGGNPEKQEE